ITRDMKSPSEYLVPRRSVLLLCLVAAAILIFQAIRIWVADYRVHTDRIDQMERGVALEPENAAAWDRLARARETDVVTLSALYPLVTILLSILFLHERLTPRQGIGIVFALIASVLLAA